MHWEHWGAHPWPFHFFWLLIIGLLICSAIYWFNRRSRKWGSFPGGIPHHEPDWPGGLDAMEVLRQRYARGEIDTTTFEQMRERLGNAEPRP
jgi:putative membrane protein